MYLFLENVHSLSMAEQKYRSLRKRLDHLGYRQPLPIEAIPLVEKLFADLIHTTESFKNYKQKREHLNSSIKSLDHSQPYQAENAKLVKENNDLHLQILQLKEAIDKVSVDFKAEIHKLDNENQDLRFLNTQYMHKIKSIEKEGEAKNKHIQNLQEKNLNAVVETPGGRQKNIPFRRQRMDIDSTLPSNTASSGVSLTSTINTPDPYVADLLGLADNQIEDLKKKLKKTCSEVESCQKEIDILKNQVKNRDEEIKRLNRQLEGGRPVEAVLKESARSSNDRVVSHLNVQVDYLQQANRDLEKQLSRQKEKESDLKGNLKQAKKQLDEFSSEISALNKKCKHLGKEKRKSDKEVDDQLAVLNSELNEKRDELKHLQDAVLTSRKERESLIEENQVLVNGTHTCEKEKNELVQLLRNVEQEKRRLLEKNSRLTVSSRELAMDLERLKISKGAVSKKAVSSDHIDFLVQNLEDDRDYYKKEYLLLQKILHDKYKMGADSHNTESFKVYSSIQEKTSEMRRNIFDHRPPYSPPYSPPTKEQPTASEVNRLRKERDKLREMLDDFQRHLDEIQKNVRRVTLEKDTLQNQYDESMDEVKRLRQQINRSRSPQTFSQNVTTILERAEGERDDALSDLRKSKSEIKKLKSFLKEAKEEHVLETKRHSMKKKELEDLLQKLETDNVSLKRRIDAMETNTESLKDEIKRSAETLRVTQDEKYEKEAQISKLRLLIEQSDRDNKDLKNKLRNKLNDIEAKQHDYTSLEERCDLYENEIIDLKNELLRAKNAIANLDREKDELQQQLDEKTEKLVRLDEDLKAQEVADGELKYSVEGLEENLKFREQQLHSKDREIASMGKQIQGLEEEIMALSKSRDISMKEIRRVQDDLATMTSENNVLHKNLEDVLDENHVMKQQIEEYTLQLNRVQDLLSEKDLEKEDLLLQFKTLSNKADILETNVQQSEGQAFSMKQDALQKQQQIVYLEDRCAALENEIERHVARHESYENQVADLSQNIVSLETQLKNTSEEKETILEDLFAVRELCVKLDKTREELTKRITSNTTGQEQLETMLEEAKLECESLKKQVLSEKKNVTSLENLISSSREKQYYDKRTIEESEEELQSLRKHMSQCGGERLAKEKELSVLRSENISLHEKVLSLSKDLTSEKYESERLKQDFRRKSQSPTNTEGKFKGTQRSNELEILRGSYFTTSLHQHHSGQKISPSVSPLQASLTTDQEN